MWEFIKAIISPVTKVVGKISDNKKEVKVRNIDRIVNAEDRLAEWEMIQAENSSSTWKDEFWTIVLAIPLVFAFVPEAVPVIKAGFAVISEMPTFYQYWLGIAIMSSFGIKALKK